MDTEDTKDTEENKRMGIGDGGNGTWIAQHNQKKEIIILWTRNEKRRRLSGEINHARHYTPGARKQGKQRLRWMDNMEEWTGMPFEDLWGRPESMSRSRGPKKV